MTEVLTQIPAQVTNNNKKEDVSKQMMKNIKIFDGTNKVECITWLSQIEAATRFSSSSFRELICQSMASSMYIYFQSSQHLPQTRTSRM